MLSIAREVVGTVQSILTVSKVSARWMMRMLTDDQKRTRLNISRYLLSCYEDDPGNITLYVIVSPYWKNLNPFSYNVILSKKPAKHS